MTTLTSHKPSFCCSENRSPKSLRMSNEPRNRAGKMHGETDTHSASAGKRREQGAAAGAEVETGVQAAGVERRLLPSGRVVTEVPSPSEQPSPRSTAAECRAPTQPSAPASTRFAPAARRGAYL